MVTGNCQAPNAETIAALAEYEGMKKDLKLVKKRGLIIDNLPIHLPQKRSWTSSIVIMYGPGNIEVFVNVTWNRIDY